MSEMRAEKQKPRHIIEIDEDLCNGCGDCIIACAESALELVDGKAKLVRDIYCDGLGACIGECPTGALKIVERPAEDFDMNAVEQRIAEMKTAEPHAAKKADTTSIPCGCPSAQLKDFSAGSVKNGASHERTVEIRSALTHWPLKIRLVPPTAPFLENADLLVAADCVPFAYNMFHQDMLDGKVVMIGCPKFEDTQYYVQKFADIFNTATLKSITVVVMEVPCCSGLPRAVNQAMQMTGSRIPLTLRIISLRGEILAEQRMA